ncbi:HYR domain-containing protein [Ammoniphilus sp. YIM 78166]|uniref:HYR domain-containing protein n=1 Tax=Ammoniphilus sp. YIM 78166 TaxID=1644106 RepID=UPI00106F8EF4|nr:HYR domain-containing protein [Ammoniphilus sp. YIM 78166]
MPSEVFVPSVLAPTIQAGINAVDPGGTVHVAPGLYPTPSTITVDKPVTIVGPQANVDPRPNCFTSRTPGDPTTEAIVDGLFTVAVIFRIQANDVTINGLEIRNGTGDLIESLAAAPVKERTRILYNIIHDSSGDEGVQLRNVSNGSISFNHVYNTLGDGINFCCGTINSTISFNEVHDIRSTDAAIYVYESTNVDIEGNLVYNVVNNDGIKRGRSDGFDVNRTGGVIRHNIVHDTNQDGITVYTSNTIIDGNEIYRSRSRNGALHVSFNVNNIVIQNNCIHDNGVPGDGRTTFGIRIGGGTLRPSNVVVNNNNLFDNPEGQLFYNSVPVLNAENNWWGSPSGPSPGSIMGNVDFIPFLEAPAPVCNPSIICPGDITTENDPGQCSGTVSYTIEATSFDCGIIEIACDPGGTHTFFPPEQSVSITEVQSFPVGSHTVTCTATNASGDTAECSFAVTVNDTEPPQLTCNDMTVPADPGQCSAVVSEYDVTVSDNCPGVTLVCDPPPGSAFPMGPSTVNCTATDAAGHQTSCSFTITVTPSITCSADITVLADPGENGAIVNYPDPAVSDCPGFTVSCNPPSGSFFPLGTTTVTCTARDDSGNANACSFTVTVIGAPSPAPTPEPFQNECIRVQKVFDWVYLTNRYRNKIQLPEACSPIIEERLAQGHRLTARCTTNPDHVLPIFPLLPQLQPAPTPFICPGARCDFGPDTATPVRCIAQDGTTVNLQAIPFLFTVCVRVDLIDINANDVICTDNVFVQFDEEVALCWERGLNIQCRTLDVICNASFRQLGAFAEPGIFLTVNICKEIQVVAEVKLELPARFCQPRGPVECTATPFIDDCPPLPSNLFPPQCPSLFPSSFDKL